MSSVLNYFCKMKLCHLAIMLIFEAHFIRSDQNSLRANPCFSVLNAHCQNCSVVSIDQPSRINSDIVDIQMKNFAELSMNMPRLPKARSYLVILWSSQYLQTQQENIQKLHEVTEHGPKINLYVFGNMLWNSLDQMNASLLEVFSEVLLLRTVNNEEKILVYEYCNEELRLIESWKNDRLFGSIPRVCSSKSLFGKHVQVSVLGIPPYVQYTSTGIEGTDVNIVSLLAEKMGFTFFLKPERTWRKRIANTSEWTGTFGSVMNSESLFGIGNIILSNAGNIPVYFCHGLYPMDVMMLTPRPKPLHPISNFLRPFSLTVWLGLFVIQVGGTLILSFLFATTHRQESFKSPRDTLWKSIAITLSALTNKSNAVKVSSSLHIRLFLSFWLIATFFTILFYLSNYRAYMVKIDYEKPIETEQDLIYNDIDLFFPRGTELYTVYETSKIPVRREIFERSIESGSAYIIGANGGATAEALTLMCKETSAVLTFDAVAAGSNEDFMMKCNASYFMIGRRKVFGFHGTIITPKYMPWQEDVDRFLLRLVENGIIKHLIESSIDQIQQLKATADTTNNLTLDPLRVMHIAGALIFLGTGLGISCFAFMYEKLERGFSKE